MRNLTLNKLKQNPSRKMVRSTFEQLITLSEIDTKKVTTLFGVDLSEVLWSTGDQPKAICRGTYMTLLIQLHPPNTYTRSRTNSNTMTLVFVDLPLLPFPTLSAHLRYPHIQILFDIHIYKSSSKCYQYYHMTIPTQLSRLSCLQGQVQGSVVYAALDWRRHLNGKYFSCDKFGRKLSNIMNQMLNLLLNIFIAADFPYDAGKSRTSAQRTSSTSWTSLAHNKSTSSRSKKSILSSRIRSKPCVARLSNSTSIATSWWSLSLTWSGCRWWSMQCFWRSCEPEATMQTCHRDYSRPRISYTSTDTTRNWRYWQWKAKTHQANASTARKSRQSKSCMIIMIIKISLGQSSFTCRKRLKKFRIWLQIHQQQKYLLCTCSRSLTRMKYTKYRPCWDFCYNNWGFLTTFS